MAKETEKKKRSLADKMAGVIPITLGGETRSVKVLSVRESVAFRAAAAPLFEPMADLVLKMQQSVAPGNAAAAVGLGGSAAEKRAAAEKAAAGQGLAMLPKIMPWLMGEGLTMLVDLPYQYAPELEEFRESATDAEEIAAGSVVLGLMFPLFMTLLMQLPEMLSGMAGDSD